MTTKDVLFYSNILNVLVLNFVIVDSRFPTLRAMKRLVG